MNPDKQNYVVPRLEVVQNYVTLTGISLPIGTSNFTDSFEFDFLDSMDFMEGEQ